VLGKLLLILVAVFAVSAVANVFESRRDYEPWYLASAQMMTNGDRVVHVNRTSDGHTLAFETPLMNRTVALAIANSGNMARNAVELGYRTFTFSNGMRTWTYDLQKRSMTP